MHEMMDSQLAKQHREEVMREVELNRLVRALRATRKLHDGGRSAVVWEMKRHAGGLLKFLRKTLSNAGY